MKNLYTAHVKVTGGRHGTAVSSDGQLSLKLGFPKELGGAGDAACFASTLKAVAGGRSLTPGPITIDADGVLSLRDDGTYIVSRVTLTVHAPGLGEAGPSLIEDAKRFCAYSNATRGNVHTDVVLA